MNVAKDRKRNEILTALSVVVALAVAILIGYKFKVGYISADDIKLRDIVSGVKTGTPDAHLATIMYPLGLLLKALYSFTATIPWLDILVILLTFFAFQAIIKRVGSIGETMLLKIIGMLLAAALVLIMYLEYMVAFRFWALSAFLAATSVLWTVTLGAVKTEPTKDDEVFVIMLFFAFSLMFDYRAFAIAVPFEVMAVAYSFVRSEIEEMGGIKKKKILRKRIAAWVIRIAVFAGIAAVIIVWHKTANKGASLSLTVEKSDFNALLKAEVSSALVMLGEALYDFITSLNGLLALLVSAAAVSISFVKRDIVGTIVSLLGVCYEFLMAGVMHLGKCLTSEAAFEIAFLTMLFEAGVLLRGYVRGLKRELASEFKSVNFGDIYSEAPGDKKFFKAVWGVLLGVPSVLILIFAGMYKYDYVCDKYSEYIRTADTQVTAYETVINEDIM